jgi:hypothetical protein
LLVACCVEKREMIFLAFGEKKQHLLVACCVEKREMIFLAFGEYTRILQSLRQAINVVLIEFVLQCYK